jgi:hypothetical protein
MRLKQSLPFRLLSWIFGISLSQTYQFWNDMFGLLLKYVQPHIQFPSLEERLSRSIKFL